MSILLVFKRVRCRCSAPGAVQAADDTPAAAVAALFVTIMKHFNTAAAEKPPKIVELQTNLLLCSCIFNSQIRPLLVLEPSRYRVSHIIGPTLHLSFSRVLEHIQRNFS